MSSPYIATTENIRHYIKRDELGNSVQTGIMAVGHLEDFIAAGELYEIVEPEVMARANRAMEEAVRPTENPTEKQDENPTESVR